MSRFVLLIAFVACANRANTTQGNAADCTTEKAAELAAREASSAYQNLKEARVVADTLADSIAVAVVDSVAYVAYDSLFASLRTIFGPEAAAAFDQYMDAKQAFYAVGTPIDETALSDAFEIGKYLFNAAGVMHRLTASEIAIWGSEYYPAWDRFNAAGKEITKQAAAAAHKANCAFYNDAILSLDAPDASVGYRAAILAFSGAYLEICAPMPSSQFFGFAYGLAGRLDQAARYNVFRTALNTSYYTSSLYWGLEAVSETAERAALIALTSDCSQ